MSVIMMNGGVASTSVGVYEVWCSGRILFMLDDVLTDVSLSHHCVEVTM